MSPQIAPRAFGAAMRCERCGRERPGGEEPCPHCGVTRTAVGNAHVATPGGTDAGTTAWTRTATHDGESGTAPPRPAPPPEPTIEPGTVFASRYRILAFAGRGAMGEVYRAEDLKLGQVVALKFLREETGGDQRYLARLLNEVKTARQVAHPNVCRVYDVGEAEGRHFLSMEWIDGETLAARLARTGRPAADEALLIARRLCAGLAAAHERGVMHRDLTPSNVMLDERGAVRITDFGVAELARVVRGRRAREGTPAYMAPEQFAGREVTAQSDIYSLGLVLYELFTGRQAYHDVSTVRTAVAPLRDPPTPPSSLAPDVDPAIEAAILSCLASDPARRPASARQVGEALPGDDALFEAGAAAQQRADRIAAFRAELAELREAGVLEVDRKRLAAIEKYHESVLGDLVRRFDVDLTLRGRQLSLGMRIASLLGAIAFSFAAWFFFQRIWGYLATPVQLGLLVTGPVAAVLGTAYAARREKSLYFTTILAILAFALFAIDLSVAGAMFSLSDSPWAWLAVGRSRSPWRMPTTCAPCWSWGSSASASAWAGWSRSSRAPGGPASRCARSASSRRPCSARWRRRSPRAGPPRRSLRSIASRRSRGAPTRSSSSATWAASPSCHWTRGRSRSCTSWRASPWRPLRSGSGCAPAGRRRPTRPASSSSRCS